MLKYVPRCHPSWHVVILESTQALDVSPEDINGYKWERRNAPMILDCPHSLIGWGMITDALK